jgi:hypothetical protein
MRNEILEWEQDPWRGMERLERIDESGAMQVSQKSIKIMGREEEQVSRNSMERDGGQLAR